MLGMDDTIPDNVAPAGKINYGAIRTGPRGGNREFFQGAAASFNEDTDSSVWRVLGRGRAGSQILDRSVANGYISSFNVDYTLSGPDPESRH